MPHCVLRTYVIILSLPHPLMPRIAFSWALQTARGRMMVRSQSTTQPSASPVARRSFCLTNVAACTWALCPRNIAFGDGVDSAMFFPRLSANTCQLRHCYPSKTGCIIRRKRDRPAGRLIKCQKMMRSSNNVQGVWRMLLESRAFPFMYLGAAS